MSKEQANQAEIKPLQKGQAYDGYLPGDKAAEIWIKLHETSISSICGVDALTKSERELYESLTAKFILDSKALFVIEPENQ